MLSKDFGKIIAVLALILSTAFTASAAPLYLPVVTAVDSAFIEPMAGSTRVLVDPLQELQIGGSVGQFSNNLDRSTGRNNVTVQTIDFARSQNMTGLLVSNVFSMHEVLMASAPTVQFARLHLYDSAGQSILSTLIKGSTHGTAFVDFGGSVSGINSIVLSGSGSVSAAAPMSMVSTVFVSIAEPITLWLLMAGLLVLAATLRRNQLTDNK